jgi:hypothetical protein
VGLIVGLFGATIICEGGVPGGALGYCGTVRGVEGPRGGTRATREARSAPAPASAAPASGAASAAPASTAPAPLAAAPPAAAAVR